MERETLGNPNNSAPPPHDLRVALQTILGFAQLLGSTPLTAVQAGYLAHVERAASGLLDETAGGARPARLLFERVVIRVDDAVNAVVRELAPARAEMGVEVESHASGLSVRGDREQLEQMLANLLTCAIRSTEPGRTIHLRAHRSGDAVQLTLSDTGIAVPNDLTIARRLAELMGGELDWRHEPNGTTAVSARLPAV